MLESRIEEICLHGFKAINEVRLINPAPINFLVGPNGSGKSSLLDFFALLRALRQRNESVTTGSFGNILNLCRLDNYASKFTIKYPTQINGAINITLSAQSHNTIIVDSKNGGSPLEKLDRAEFNNFSDISAIFCVIDPWDAEGANVGKYTFDKPFTGELDRDQSIILDFLKNQGHNFLQEDERPQALQRSISNGQTLQIRIVNTQNNTERLVELDSLSSGQKHQLSLLLDLKKKLRDAINGYAIKSNRHFLVVGFEEPERGLHPSLQKLLPGIFAEARQSLMKECELVDVIFFITTHSPFLLSGAFNDKISDCYKAYLFSDGGLVNLNGSPSNSSPGFQGSNILPAIHKLLGSGFDDYSPLLNQQSPATFFICEGRDDRIYSALFHGDDRFVNTIFLGCRHGQGLTRVISRQRMADAIIPDFIGVTVKVFGIVDASCSENPGTPLYLPGGGSIPKTDKENPRFTDEQRKQFLSAYEGNIRMLKRKEIENYLFDNVVQIFFSTSPFKAVEPPADRVFLDGDVKDLLNQEYCGKIDRYVEIARYINANRDAGPIKKLYEELASCVLNIDSEGP